MAEGSVSAPQNKHHETRRLQDQRTRMFPSYNHPKPEAFRGKQMWIPTLATGKGDELSSSAGKPKPCGAQTSLHLSPLDTRALGHGIEDSLSEATALRSCSCTNTTQGSRNRAEAAISLPALTSLFTPRDLPRQLETPFPNTLASEAGSCISAPPGNSQHPGVQSTASTSVLQGSCFQPCSGSQGRGPGPIAVMERSPATATPLGAGRCPGLDTAPEHCAGTPVPALISVVTQAPPPTPPPPQPRPPDLWLHMQAFTHQAHGSSPVLLLGTKLS